MKREKNELKYTVISALDFRLMDFEHCASMVYESWLVVHIRYYHYCSSVPLNGLDSNPNIEHNNISYISMIDRSIVPYSNTIVHWHLHIVHYRINMDRFESTKRGRSTKKPKKKKNWPLYKIYHIQSLNSSPSLQHNNCVYWRRPHVQNLSIENIRLLCFGVRFKPLYRLDIYSYQYQSLHILHLQIIPDIFELMHRQSSFHAKLRRTQFDWCIRLNSIVVPSCHTHSVHNHLRQTIENLPRRWSRWLSMTNRRWNTNHKPRNNLNLKRRRVGCFFVWWWTFVHFFCVKSLVDCTFPDNIHIDHRLTFVPFSLNRHAKSDERILHFHISHRQNQW